MALKIEPINKIKISLGIQPNGAVQSYFTNLCYKYMDEFVPREYGDLRKNVTITANSITYESPYASYQYRGMREDGSHIIVSGNYTTPGTGPHWDERMLDVKREDLEKKVQEFVDRGG